MLYFCRFPSNETSKWLWVKVLRDGGRCDDWEPTNNTKICSLHFNVDDIKIGEKGTQIERGAMPAIPKTDMKKVDIKFKFLAYFKLYFMALR